MPELKAALGTQVDMTFCRKLAALFQAEKLQPRQKLLDNLGWKC